MDRIFLRDICLSCTIGVNDWERGIQQPVEVDLDLDLDLREAGKKDDLNLTVDYEEIHNRIEEIVNASKFLLLEALAERIAQACLEDPKIKAVRVRLVKPGALRATRTVGVEVFRRSE